MDARVWLLAWPHFPGMPFKAKAKARHHIPDHKYRVENWREYDASLKQRGNIITWFSEDVIAQWRAKPRTTPGGQAYYSLLAILTALSLRAVFHTALRQTGLLESILTLFDLDLPVPDHSTLSRRGSTLVVPKLPRAKSDIPIHLIVDSTGLKLHGPGEWTVEKHGTKTCKSWRKMHLGTDAATGKIVACLLTTKEVYDACQVASLLDQINEPIAAFLADGAYDTENVTSALTEHHPSVAIIVPQRITAVLSEHAQTNPTQRDQHIRDIDKHGRSGWQERSGYTIRSRVENSIGRFKQILGDALRSQADENQATEIDVTIHVLNGMLALGRPQSVRVA